MQTSKYVRSMLLIVGVMVALLTAACGGSAAPTAETTTGGGGDPTAPVKGFFDAVFTGTGDIEPLVCAAEASQVDQMKAGFEQITASFTSAGAKVDTSGLTYTVKDETADKATVTVGGTLSVDMSGTKTDVPMTETDIPVSKDGDAWKLCGS